MHIHQLLRFLLSRVLTLSIVEGEGGGAAVVDEDDGPGEEAGEGKGDGDTDDGDDDEAGDDEGTEGGAADEGEEGAEDGVVVTIGDQPPEDAVEDDNKAPPWVRDLRKSNREKDKRIRELEQQVAKATPAPAAIVVGEEPTFESCGFDADELKKQTLAWADRKNKAEAQQREAADADKKAKDAWQVKLDAYSAGKTKLKVPDFDVAEDVVKDTLSVMQQGIIVNGTDKPELLVYALGKNPKKAKELAAIADPVKFAVAIGKLETQLKVTPRKAAPAPDSTVRSTVAGAAAVDSALAKLRADAEKSGDYTKVHQHKQQQRAKLRQKQQA